MVKQAASLYFFLTAWSHESNEWIRPNNRYQDATHHQGVKALKRFHFSYFYERIPISFF